jgi:hypothetical protein
MGADEMTDRIAEGSPRLKARMAGPVNCSKPLRPHSAK